VTLTQNTIPSHQHEVSIPVSENVFGSGTENNMGYLQKTSVNNVFQTVKGGNTAKGFSMSTKGSTQAHENRQPYLAVNYCIALNGIFPSRS
jgi:microcystin-dependent protein